MPWLPATCERRQITCRLLNAYLAHTDYTKAYIKALGGVEIAVKKQLEPCHTKIRKRML